MRRCLVAATLAVSGSPGPSLAPCFAADVVKANNADNLNLGSSWVGGTAPGTGDVGVWDATVTGTSTVALGANLSWQGLRISSASPPGGAVTMTGPNSITLGTGGLDVGTTNFTWSSSSGFTISGATGTFAGSSLVTIGGAATKNWGGGGVGITAVTFTGTLALSGGTGASGAFSNNWLALGQNGGVTQTGAFHLDTGASLTDRGELIVTQGWGDGTTRPKLTLASLTGFGDFRSDYGSNSIRTLLVDQAVDTTYSGRIVSSSLNVRGINLEKSGAGTLTLAGASSPNQTTVSGGTLKLTNAGALGGTSGGNGTPIIIRSGTLDLGYTASTNAYAASTLNFSMRTGNITLGGQAGATPRIMTSSTSVGGGGPPGLGFGGGFGTTLTYDATNNPGTATVASIWSAVGGIGVLSSTVSVGDSAATAVELDFTARLSSTCQEDGRNATLVKQGPGTMRISATNNFPLLQVDAGTLLVNNAAALGTSRTGDTGSAHVVTNNATIDVNGFSPSVGTIAGSTGTFTNNAAATTSTLTIGAANQSGSFSGAIVDGVGRIALTKSGAGILTIGGSTGYSGLTTVSSGTLAYTTNASLGSNLSGVSGAVVQFGANSITIGSTAAGDSSATFGGILNGTGAVLLRGGSSSVVNATTGAAGTAGNFFILAATTANLPPTAFALDTGASTTNRKDFSYTNNTGDVLTLSSLAGFGAIRNDSGGSAVMRFITVNQAGDTTFDGALTSHRSTGGVNRSLTLEKTGPGSLTLAGFVGKQTASAGAGASPLNLVANGGLLLVTNPANTTTANTGAINTSGTVTITSGTLGFAPQSLVNTAGSTGVASILMNGGVLRWHGINTQDITAGASSRLAVVAGKTATFDTNGNDVTLANAFAGGAINAAVSKIGLGRLTLTAANTYTGTTGVGAGTLAVEGSLATSALTVADGATLMGSGSIAGATTIYGLHAPGSSPGIQTFGNDLTYDGADIVWELTVNGTAQAGPAVFDQLVVGADLDFATASALTLAFDQASTVNWTNAFWGSDREWLVYDVTGTTTNLGSLAITPQNWQDGSGNFFYAVRPNGSFSLRQAVGGGDVYLVYAAVPEPGSLVLVGTGLVAAAWCWCRRRRRSV